jgi:Carboxypeptidase regulatory-like domain/TonB dependent receptor/TonB-dependent Receptor Plug Domain
MRPKILTLFLLTSIVYGQNPTASITGQVRDQSGGAVPGARVRVINTATNGTRATLTGSDGSYALPLLPIGIDSVTVEASGFKTDQRKGVELQIDQKAEMNFTLQLGEVNDVVNVESEAPLLQTESHSTGTVIENKKIVELPLNSRTFYSLAYLVPGVMPPATNSTLGYRGGFNVAGSSESSNNFTLDGIDNNNDSINGPGFRPSVDSIQEFKVQTGMYSAEYGRSSGGQVVVTTKSGSNALHGTAYEFLRNQVLDARNFFTPASGNPVFKRNQFGATTGGPVIKNRTFFFVNYEGLRLRQEVNATSTVPTADMLNGDFRSLLTLAKPVHVVDPTTGLDFAIPNVVPASRMNALGVAMSRYFPAPTLATGPGLAPSGNYFFDQLRTESLNQYGIKVDHQLGAKDSLYGTYNHFDDPTFEPSNTTCGARTLPGFGCNSGLTTQLAGLVETHIFTPALINEVRLGFNRYRQTRLPPDGTTDFVDQHNIQGVYIGNFPANYGLPVISIKGFSTLGLNTNLPQDLITNKYQVYDSVVYVKGKNTVKVGFDLRRSQGNDISGSNGRGTFTFNADSTTLTSGYSPADLLLGYATSSARNQQAPKIYERTWAVNTFLQDDWKLTPTLTLNLGIRWELNTPVVVRYNQLSNFNAATGQLYVAGQNGNSPNVYQYDKNNFQPRLGLAWSATSKTVFRAGYGVYGNGPTTYNGIGSIYFNPPFRSPQTFTASKTVLVTLDNPFPTAIASGSTTLTAIAQDFADAYVQQWGAGVQQTISNNVVLDVSYFGSKGTRLPNEININQPLPGPGTSAQVNARRPYPNYGTISWFESDANSTFHSLQVKLDKRFSTGFSVLSSYTYSKSIDDSPGFASNSNASKAIPQNAYNLSAERGLSDFDVRQRWVLSPIYQLPFGAGRSVFPKGAGSKVLGGWQISGILSMQSGSPFTPYYTANLSNTFTSSDRPNVIGNPNTGPKTVQQWFNTGAFQAPAPGTFGNAGRNIIHGPALYNLDLALSRTFSIRERLALQFRSEFFNSLNHPNFTLPLATVDGAGYGQVTSALDPRQLQFALKIIF